MVSMCPVWGGLYDSLALAFIEIQSSCSCPENLGEIWPSLPLSVDKTTTVTETARTERYQYPGAQR